jgi:hypothetical protein
MTRSSKFSALCLVVAIAIAATSAIARADDPKAESKGGENKLVGTWRLISAKYGGMEFKFPEGTTMVKHVTPAQFMWATYDKDGNVSRAAGGTYSLKGEVYEETPEYGVGNDFELIKGKSHVFKWKVDGKNWFHDGKLSNDLTIEEVWERVDKK